MKNGKRFTTHVITINKPYPVLVAILAFAVYALTTAPAVYTWDSATFTAGAYTLGIVHAPGYPLYLLLLRGFAAVLPGVPFAWAVNLFSAVCGALTVGVLARVLALVNPGRGGVNAAVALVFAFSPTIWGQSVRAEVYSLNTLLVGLLLLGVIQMAHRRAPSPSPTGSLTASWRGVALAALAGLAAGHHPAGALVVAVVVVWHIGGRARGHSPKMAAQAGVMLTLLAAYALTYLYLPLRSMQHPAFDLVATYFPNRDLSHLRDVLWMMRGGMFADRVFGLGPPGWLRDMGQFLLMWGQHTLGAGAALTVVGFWRLWRRDRWLGGLLVTAFVVQVIFFTGYDVFDKWEMFHTAYLVGSIGLAVGLSALPNLPRWVLIGAVIGQAGLNLNAGAFNERRYEQQAAAILQTLPPDATLIGPWTSIRPVEAVQLVYDVRRDVRTVDTSLLALGLDDNPTDIAAATDAMIREAQGPVFVVQPSAGLRAGYDLELVAPGLYKVWILER